MTNERRNMLWTLAFYAVAVLTVIGFNMSDAFKSGPCTPNLDVLSFFALGPLSFIAALITAFLAFFHRRPMKLALWVHVGAFWAWIIFLYSN